MPIPTTPLDLVGTPARDQVYELLLHRLVTGQLAPGARLSDHQLLTLTNSSRAPLREAVSRLVHVGLVTVVPRQFTEVTSLDDRRARESLAVEGELVAQAIVEAVPDLRDDDRRSIATVVADRDVDVLLARRQLIETFVAGAANREYTRICADLAPYVERALTLLPSLDTASLHGHLRELAQAAVEGDVEAAAVAWRAQESLTTTSIGRDGYRQDDRPAPVRSEAATLRDKAADAIESAIVDGTLVPGEVLRESALMAWLGISRTPIREALLQLAARGAVEVEHHRPARVATMDERTTLDGLRALGVLRRLGVREAMRDDPVGFTTRMRRAASGSTEADHLAGVIAISSTISDALDASSSNAVWIAVHRLLTARVRWYATHDEAILRGVDPVAVDELVAALAAGQTDRAEQVLWTLHNRVPRSTTT